MSALSFEISIDDVATPRIKKLMASLRQQERLTRKVGRSVQNGVSEHVLNIAQTRHATADRLGAKRTGFYASAYEKVSSPGAISIDGNTATIWLRHPGFARAFRAVTINPTGGLKYLTIPLHADSYGKPIRRGSRSRFGGFFFRSKNGNLLYAVSTGKGQMKLLYVLKTSVTQPQDRTLLPKDSEIRKWAREGAIEFIDSILGKRQ